MAKTQPLQQRSTDEDTHPVGGEHVVDHDTKRASQEYSIPGHPDQEAAGYTEDQEASRAYEKESAKVTADTGIAEREANRGLVVPVQNPEVNYAARDNIVYPDARPGEVALVQAIAEANGVKGEVEYDPTDRAVIAVKSDASLKDLDKQQDQALKQSRKLVEDGRVTGTRY